LSGWNKFIDSLATRGGSIFILCIFVFLLGALMFHVLHHSDNDQVVTVILSTFSGFSGALLTALTSMTRSNQGGSNASTTSNTSGPASSGK